MNKIEEKLLSQLRRNGGRLTRAELRFEVALPNDVVEVAIDDLYKRGLVEIESDDGDFEFVLSKE